MKVLNFGSCNIDYVYDVPHFVKPGETISSEKLTLFPGGKGLNQSIAIAKSGVKVWHAGCIGKDGRFLRDVLAEAGVELQYLKTVDSPSGHAIIQVDSSCENSILLFNGANHMITENFADEVLSGFDAGDILVLQNEINNIEYIIEKAHDKGMKIVLNPSPFDTELMRRIRLDCLWTLMLNEVEGGELTGEDEPEKICAVLRKKCPSLNVVLTLGSRGCVYSGSGKLIHCPAFKVKAVDTTSAGDTFTGYYISGVLDGMKTEDILRRASAASALAVSRKGAATSIPMHDEVERALAEEFKTTAE